MSEVLEQEGELGGGQEEVAGQVGGREGGSGDYRVTSALFLPPRPEKQEVLRIRHYCDGEEMQGPLK